jgi:hypothetical protein
MVLRHAEEHAHGRTASGDSETGSAPLKVLGQVAIGMLVVTAMAPTRGWYLNPLHPLKSEPVRILGAVTAKLLIAAVAVALMYFEIRPALEALAGWNEK